LGDPPIDTTDEGLYKEALAIATHWCQAQARHPHDRACAQCGPLAAKIDFKLRRVRDETRHADHSGWWDL
jgi:hypothetical protein